MVNSIAKQQEYTVISFGVDIKSKKVLFLTNKRNQFEFTFKDILVYESILKQTLKIIENSPWLLKQFLLKTFSFTLSRSDERNGIFFENFIIKLSYKQTLDLFEKINATH